MSQDAVERLLGRLITDADFRGHVARSLEGAVCQVGISLSEVELSLLRNIDMAPFAQAAELLDGSLRRS